MGHIEFVMMEQRVVEPERHMPGPEIAKHDSHSRRRTPHIHSPAQRHDIPDKNLGAEMKIRARAADPELRGAAPVLVTEVAVDGQNERAAHSLEPERIRAAELERRIDELAFPRAPADVGSGRVLELHADARDLSTRRA